MALKTLGPAAAKKIGFYELAGETFQ